MAKLTAIEVATIAKQYWTRPNTVIAVAIMRAESAFKTDAVHDNTKDDPPGKGIDRGIAQINSVYHAEVSDECAFDAECAIKEMRRIYGDNGNTFNPWSAFKNGSYIKYLELAECAVDAVMRLKGKDAVIAVQSSELAEAKQQAQDFQEAYTALLAKVVYLKSAFGAWVDETLET